jgi:hypothetical protein
MRQTPESDCGLGRSLCGTLEECSLTEETAIHSEKTLSRFHFVHHTFLGSNSGLLSEGLLKCSSLCM